MEATSPLGRIVRRQVVKLVDFGVYLGDDVLGEVLLPKRDVPSGCDVGDWLEVFIYKDSDDTVIATTQTPLATVGTCAYLRVAAVNEVGAFLDWGLPKDLFVPLGEQKRHLIEGRSYTVFVYIDNSERIAASPRIDRFLAETSEVHRAGQPVELLIAGRTDLGYKAVVDDTHVGLLFESDAYRPIRQGERMRGFIKEVRHDGKLDLCLRLRSQQSPEHIAERYLEHLRESGGQSTLHDKSPPEQIYKTFGVSKKVFKRVLGGLYRRRLIVIEDDHVRLLED